MPTDFKIPNLGDGIKGGDVLNVLVKVGDTVAKDQGVVELETDKATIEVPSSIAGTVAEIKVKSGDKVTVGQVVLTLNEAASASAPASPAQAAAPAAPAPQQASAPPAAPQAAAPAAPQAPPAPAAPAAPAAASGEPVTFNIPNLGDGIQGGDVLNVLVKVGDTVAKDQGVLELETDKATIEVPSSVAGTVKEIKVKAGDKVAVGQAVLVLTGGAAEAAPQAAAPAAAAPAAEAPAAPASTAPASAGAANAPSFGGKPTAAGGKSGGPAEVVDFNRGARPAAAATAPSAPPAVDTRPAAPAAPSVRRLARQLGLDIHGVSGSGPGGRISTDDVLAHAKQVITSPRSGGGAAPAIVLPDFSKWGPVERQPMRAIRRKTAEHMVASWTSVPHVTQHDKADVTDLEALRQKFGKGLEAQSKGKLTVTAVALKVAAAALKAFPQVNASVDMAGEAVILKQYVHVGVAVDTDRGLLVPVIRDVDKKSVLELAVELGQLAEKARTGKLSLDEMQGGCFTITNLGGLGGTAFTPIVNQPEAAILGMSRSRMEPVWQDGQFVPRLMLPLSLSYDHRIVDGADGIRFLRYIVDRLEHPFLLSLQ